jgi:flagellar biosynthesis component FlhA
MKTLHSFFALFALFIFALAPAMAAEQGITKGTKTYQQARSDSQEIKSQQEEQAVSTTQDVSTIEPAAGEQEQTQTDKTFKEEIRLPRKN